MARKNGNGEGSRPRERADGRWEARYWVGEKRRSVYGSTRKEAADKLAKAIASNEEPHAVLVPTNITVREFFAQYDDAVRDTMKRRSLETYRDIARLHLLPAFGSKRLTDLTREHVQRMYSQKRDASLSAARVSLVPTSQPVLLVEDPATGGVLGFYHWTCIAGAERLARKRPGELDLTVVYMPSAVVTN